jgi:hypothetical protein
MRDEKWGCCECRNQPYTVADAVRDFFSSRLLTLGYCKRYAHDITSYAAYRTYAGSLLLGAGLACSTRGQSWRMVFADKALADKPNQPAGSLQEAAAHSTTPYHAVGCPPSFRSTWSKDSPVSTHAIVLSSVFRRVFIQIQLWHGVVFGIVRHQRKV